MSVICVGLCAGRHMLLLAKCYIVIAQYSYVTGLQSLHEIPRKFSDFMICPSETVISRND